MNAHYAMNAYSNTHAHSATADASPHKLIALLLTGAIDRVSQAQGAIERSDIAKRGELIGKAISIVSNLQGGEVARNLDALYDYMQRRLVIASRDADPAVLEEVAKLLGEIKAGWDGIASEVEA